MIRATVSGSFHRHMAAIQDAVGSLLALGVDVLSPSDPRIVAADEDFLFVASDKLRSRRLVEDRHLEAIRASDFLWVVCPDGYTGPSTSGEILAAAVLRKPIYSSANALDITIGDYVEKVASMREAITRVQSARVHTPTIPHALLDPESLTDTAYKVDGLQEYLFARRGNGQGDVERQFAHVRTLLSEQFGLGPVN